VDEPLPVLMEWFSFSLFAIKEVHWVIGSDADAFEVHA
jgi:hypothetical protein